MKRERFDRVLATRRDFLRRTAVGVAGGLVLGQAGAASSEDADSKSEPKAGKTGLRLSTSSIHFHRLSVADACSKIRELGFEAVDIWSAYQGCPHLDDVQDRLGADGLRRLLTEKELKLFAFSVYVGGYPRYAELLGKVGGGVAIRGSAAPCKPAELGAKMRAFLDALKPEVELAAQHGTRLAIENHGNALLDSIDSLKAFVDRNDSPHLGVAMAPYHLQAGTMSVEEAIAVCGKQLLFFYAWQKGTGTDQLPGHGPTDFKPWLAALRKAGYEGYVNPFMHGDLEPDEMSKALAKSREYLGKCWGG